MSGAIEDRRRVPARVLHTLFVLAGVAGLLGRDQYAGPGAGAVHDWGGNASVSFAIYFLALRLTSLGRFRVLWAGGLALAAVELFEVFDGFGLMTNVYDPWDLAANAGGIALAAGVDVFSARFFNGRADRPGPGA